MMRLLALVGLLASTPTLAADLPNHKLTPGAVSDLTAEQICAKSWHTRDVRSVTVATKKEVFTSYGISCRPLFGKSTKLPRCGSWEIDHLVSLELGGSNEPRNLWPQPFSGKWNAHLKDRLEGILHHAVCRGDLPLENAQREIAKDWMTVFVAYFKEPKK